MESRTVPGKQDSIVIGDLEPKMRYEFTITPIFQDGSRGETRTMMEQTRIEGQLPET